MAKRPGEVVTAVSINSLEKTEENPGKHGDNVQVTSNHEPDQRDTNGSETEYHCFNRMSILSSHAKWSRVIMVKLVNVLVKRTIVETAVSPVVPEILEKEEYSDLKSHGLPSREGNFSDLHAKQVAHRMEEENHGQLKTKVTEQDLANALPVICAHILLFRLEFVFLEGRDEVANEEWQIAAKIDDFVHDECDHASNKDFILAFVKLDPVLFSPRQFINGSCVHC